MAWEGAAAAGVYLLLVNIATYAAFALDKRRSVEGQWRVREVSLLRLALFGGWPAAKLAQRRLRHKTRKQPFGRVLNRIGAAQLALMLLIGATGLGWTGTAMDWLSGRQWAGAASRGSTHCGGRNPSRSPACRAGSARDRDPATTRRPVWSERRIVLGCLPS